MSEIDSITLCAEEAVTENRLMELNSVVFYTTKDVTLKYKKHENKGIVMQNMYQVLLSAKLFFSVW